MIYFIQPLLIFVFLGLFSPGPNVILLTTSGARFGFKSTVPHILGVAIGVGVTSAVTGFGVGAVLIAQPALATALKLIACGWILYMAYQLWNAKAGTDNAETERPFTFVEAALFQWVNPKVWAIALSATAYTVGLSPIEKALNLGIAFSGINLGVCLFWTAAGSLLSYLLGNAVAWQIFMRTMPVLLAVFSVMVFL